MAAADFALGEFDLVTLPTLPRRSVAESMIAQAVHGVSGLAVAPDGSVVAESRRPAVRDIPPIDLDGDAFVGFRAVLDRVAFAAVDGRVVKWQFIGPVSLGVGLARAGVQAGRAFSLAGHVVRQRIAEIAAAVDAASSGAQQLMLLDEPWLVDLLDPAFPISPDEAVDLMSSGMAATPAGMAAGLHCCGPTDLAALLAAGPRVISVPVADDVVEWSGYLTRFLDEGGVVAWGVVPTHGPVPDTADRYWRALSDVWCGLVRRGCDPVVLRRQSLVSPICGLAGHTPETARHVARLTANVGSRVHDQAGATRFSLGA